MKFEFDHRHYVPVLRFRRGEKVAMRQLGPNVRRGITPLLEIVPITDYSPRTVADEIRRHWGPSRFFFDLHHLPNSEDTSFVLKMDQAMRDHGLLSVPVVHLTNTRRFREAVAHIVAQNGRGACVRLFPEDLRRGSLAADLERLMNEPAVAASKH